MYKRAELNPNDMLAMQRYAQIMKQNQQRQIQYMSGALKDKNAATNLERLGMAQGTSIAAATLLGAGVGALAGVAKADDNQGGAAFLGALLGGGAGLLAGSIGSGIGSLRGKLTAMDRPTLKKQLEGLSASDYLIPGKASYLQAQLDKSLMQNESDATRPKQYVF